MRFKAHNQQGFTVIELLVTASIITVLSLVVLFQYTSFNGGALLTNQAYKIALDIREMQIFALGERIDGASARDEFGVEFQVDTTDGYQRFRNIDTNLILDASDTIISDSIVDSRFAITDIRADSTTLSSGDVATILFRRPNYDAIFGADAVGASQVEIDVASDDGTTRTIIVTSTGQITVQ